MPSGADPSSRTVCFGARRAVTNCLVAGVKDRCPAAVIVKKCVPLQRAEFESVKVLTIADYAFAGWKNCLLRLGSFGLNHI